MITTTLADIEAAVADPAAAHRAACAIGFERLARLCAGLAAVADLLVQDARLEGQDEAEDHLEEASQLLSDAEYQARCAGQAWAEPALDAYGHPITRGRLAANDWRTGDDAA